MTSRVPDISALVGPTAVGKTDVSIEVARALDAEIVSCDSMQVYRHMPILSQAPTVAQREAVAHHLIACVEPSEDFSAGQYRTRAQAAIGDIRSRGKRVLIVGGTGLYLKALDEGMCAAPPADDEVRRKLWRECESLGTETLYDRLAKIDTVAAAKIHPNDAKRVIRAMEVFLISGRTLSSWWQEGKRQTKPLSIPVTGLTRERDELHARIAKRQMSMIHEDAVIDEARRMLQLPLSSTAKLVHGFTDIARYLKGELTLEEMTQTWQTRVRQYAKRQMTWFRWVPAIRWVALTPMETAEQSASRVIEQLESLPASPTQRILSNHGS